jgi:phospholipase C
MRGLGDFFSDASGGALPAGGVFYIRGGYTNLTGQVPPVTTPNISAAEKAAILKNFTGDDDHASYADSQLSQSMAARAINLIASNPAIWAQSAIIITYDESDGFYDHVPSPAACACRCS